MSTAEAAAYAEAVVRRSGTSFFWAMRVLPADKRNAMYAVYAFCREVDDIADGAGEEADKRHRLGRWRGEIERLYGGRPRVPVAIALAAPVARFGLGKGDFRAIIDGMETDAAASVRIADMDDLNLYCDRVACAVGRLSNSIFGITPDKSGPIAAALGQALQITNILRDLREDAGRDRMYLPQDLLRAHGITQSDPTAVLDHPAVAQVCELLAEVAQRRFADAAALLATCRRRQVRPAAMMMAVYRHVLRRLTARGWRPVSGGLRATKAAKLWIMVRHGVV